MFGKNDELVDQSYQHNTAPAQDTSFGSAGGDFMSAPAPQPQEYAAQQAPAAEAPAMDFLQPQQQTPTFAAPAEPAPAAPEPMQYEAAAAPETPAEAAPAFDTPIPDSMSFSARFGNQQAQPAPAMDAAPQAAAQEDFGETVIGEGAPVGVSPETLAQERSEVPQPFTQTPDFSQIAGESPSVVADAVAEEEQPAQAAPQNAFDKTGAALRHADVLSASGKTRIQAVALDSLVTRAQGGDEKAAGQLQSHGFELLENLAEGLTAGSQGLEAVVNAAAALIDEGHVTPADSKAQQTDALKTIAAGVAMQGHAAATGMEKAALAEQQQAAAQAERARPKSHTEIVESARSANEQGAPGQYL